MSVLRKGWAVALLIMCVCLSACGKTAVQPINVDEVTANNEEDSDVIVNQEENDIEEADVDPVKDIEYVATLEITINPDMLLYIDEAGKVVAVKYLNDDAKDAYEELKLVGKKVKNVVNTVVETAVNKGYLKNGGNVNISVVANGESNVKKSKIDNIINESKAAAQGVVLDILKENKLTANITVVAGDDVDTKKVVNGKVEEKAEEKKSVVTQVVEKVKEVVGSAKNDDDNNDNGSSTGSSNSTPSTPSAPIVNTGNDLNLTGYKLKWQDEFNGTSLDRSNWNVELHDPGWVNSELQSYVDSTDNIQVADGKLTIKPVKTGEGASATYTSGRINTQGKQDYTYGVFEVRAKVPQGMGYLPAFWLMPTDENLYGQWPKCGEIDAMEVMGQTNSMVYGTIHYGEPHRESQGTYTLSSGNFTDTFHTFDVEWNPGSIKWYVDGHLYHEESDWYSTKPGQGTVAYPAPFDQPFYMILNLAIGGSWVGYPDENTTYDDQAFVVDYVKVYQKDSYDTNVSKPVKEVVLRDPDANGNYINNGNFATVESLEDETNWMFRTANGGVATAVISGGEMVVTTENAGTVDYSVQLMQAGLPFEKGATYKVTFDAKADANRIINTAIKAPDYGYAEYMPSTVVSLTTAPQTFSYTFKMTADSDANGRLEFNMGACGSTAKVYIDNVKVEKTIAADPNEVEEKTVRADGNYIYNGSFQEGTGCLGYWDVSGNVSVTGITDGRRAKIVVAEGQTVTLTQTDLAFETSGQYAFSLKGEADSNKTISVNAGGNSFDINLTNSYTGYSHKVNGGMTGKNVVITFNQAGTYYIDDVRFEEDAILKNGSFKAGTSGFEVYVDSSASASYVVDELNNDKALAFTIRNTGDQDWKIQLKQPVALEQGKCYKLSFKAKTDLEGGRKIRVILQGDEDHGWATYSGENTIDLTSVYQTFEKKFKMTSATDAAANFSACFGKIDSIITTQHDVIIDDIELVEIPESDMPAPEVPAIVPTAYDTNLLNNAAFANNAEGWGTNNSGNSISYNASEIVYDLAVAATNPWDIELSQNDIVLEQNEKYVLTYDIESSIDRTVVSKFQHDGNVDNNWAGFCEQKDVYLVANNKITVKHCLTYTADSDANTLIAIDMGANTGMAQHTIKISNISLKKVHDLPAAYYGETPAAGGAGEGASDGNSDETPSLPEIGANILVNAMFNNEANNFANWGFNGSDSKATFIAVENGCKVEVSDPGVNDWDVQLKQENISLNNGKTYKVSFDIMSTASRTIKSGVMSDAGWYGGSDKALTEDEWTHVEYNFTMTKDDSASNVYISLGKIEGEDTPASDITITNIKLEREN